MILQYIDKISESIISFFERLTSAGNWKIKITFISVILSLFFAFPSYDVYLKGEFARHWQGILTQIDNPLAQHDYTPLEHSACLAFRLTPAVIAYLLRLNEFGCLVFQFVALALMFYGVVLLAEKITKDRVVSSFVSLAFAFIFAGNVLVSDLRGIFDVVAYCLLILAMCPNNSFLIALFTLLACFTDERAIVASSAIFLWFVLKETGLENFKFRKFFKIRSKASAVLMAWIAYFAIRFALGYLYGLKTSFAGLHFDRLNNFPFAIWTGLEGFWLVVVSSLLILIVKKKRSFLFWYCLSICAIVVVALSTYDLTRSMGYIIPVIFISLYIVKENESAKFVRLMTLLTFVICLFPTYYAGGKNIIQVFYPLPLQLIRMFLLK